MFANCSYKIDASQAAMQRLESNILSTFKMFKAETEIPAGLGMRRVAVRSRFNLIIIANLSLL